MYYANKITNEHLNGIIRASICATTQTIKVLPVKAVITASYNQ